MSIDLESNYQAGREIPEVSEVISGDFMVLSALGLEKVAGIIGSAVNVHNYEYDECLYYPKDLIALVGRISKLFTSLNGTQNSLNIALLNTLGFGISDSVNGELKEEDFQNFYMMNHKSKATKSVQFSGNFVKGFMSIKVVYSYAIHFSLFYGRYMHMKLSIEGNSLITSAPAFSKMISTLRRLDIQKVDSTETGERRKLKHAQEDSSASAQEAKEKINIIYGGLGDSPNGNAPNGNAPDGNAP